MVKKGIEKNEKQGQMYVLFNSKSFIKMHTPRHGVLVLFFCSLLVSFFIANSPFLDSSTKEGQEGMDQTVPQNGGRYQ